MTPATIIPPETVLACLTNCLILIENNEKGFPTLVRALRNLLNSTTAEDLTLYYCRYRHLIKVPDYIRFAGSPRAILSWIAYILRISPSCAIGGEEITVLTQCYARFWSKNFVGPLLGVIHCLIDQYNLLQSLAAISQTVIVPRLCAKCPKQDYLNAFYALIAAKRSLLRLYLERLTESRNNLKPLSCSEPDINGIINVIYRCADQVYAANQDKCNYLPNRDRYTYEHRDRHIRLIVWTVCAFTLTEFIERWSFICQMQGRPPPHFKEDFVLTHTWVSSLCATYCMPHRNSSHRKSTTR